LSKADCGLIAVAILVWNSNSAAFYGANAPARALCARRFGVADDALDGGAMLELLFRTRIAPPPRRKSALDKLYFALRIC
jgi:hypothetical protein